MNSNPFPTGHGVFPFYERTYLKFIMPVIMETRKGWMDFGYVIK